MLKNAARSLPENFPANDGFREKWGQCLEIIRAQTSAQAFQTWLAPIIPVNLVENTLILRIPSQFFFEWLETHYQDIILKTIKKIYGYQTSLEYLIASSPDKKPEPLNLSAGPQSQSPGPTTDISEETSRNSQIDSRYQFTSFLVKNDNELALRAAQTVAKQPGKTDFNPLFIYGDSGCGKTHLLHAIGNFILENKKRKKIILLSSENFINQYIYALQNKLMDDFNRRFAQTDILLIDDIQFLSNKKKSQEGIFYFFSELERQQKQVVITANQPPAQMTALDPRLLSFFQKGLIIDLAPPSHETRVNFIRSYCEKTELSLLPDVMEFLTQSLSEGMQELRAVMIRVAAQTSLLGKPVSIDAAKKLLAHIDAKWASKNGRFRHWRQIKVDDIIKTVAQYLNMPVDILAGYSRQREVTFARQVAIYLSRELSGESFQVIGYHFSDRHYTAILHSYKRIKQEMKSNPAIYNLIQEIRNHLLNKS